MKRNSNGKPTAFRRRRFCKLTVFRIATDGRLTRIRKYDVETGNDWMFWCGMVPLEV
ncbi:hypothetical protein [Paraburkholderia aspalathi]|uniref:Uncharacterized protein n=1 Tax=Paraburkholderia aspalathi TaxID=1324617 RepID=A0A1I7DA91_9BURK|nr:hypothetical protein [Paraburkholderia aspalathi]SFU08648.1 hypothetical protein SAMN05192563_100991 [Paraburkholderia aspalathi]